MKIGFAQIFPYRPHPAHEAYLKHLVELSGYETRVIVCGGSRTPCYNKAMKGNRRFECLKCGIGGSRAYWPNKDITILDTTSRINADYNIPDSALIESAGLLFRTETFEEERSVEFQRFFERFRPIMTSTISSVIGWIEKERLDGLVVFNGRQDMTAAIVMGAKRCGIPVITHERTWFGPGLSLNPGVNCNSLKNVEPMVKEFDSLALTDFQSSIAFDQVASRFQQLNALEWRLYNPNPESTDWPGPKKGESGRNVLIIPSSRCEFVGNMEYATPWADNLSALSLLIDRIKADKCSVVLRCHPVWAQRIGPRDGKNIEKSYVAWAKQHSVEVVPSASKKSTYDLIRESDAVILNGGSSAVEAGFLGKEVICLGPSPYSGTKFVRSLLSEQELSQFKMSTRLSKNEICMSTLRYVYTRYGRLAQFVDYVRPVSTTKYRFFDGADPDRLTSALFDQRLAPDDATFDSDGTAERELIARAIAGDVTGFDGGRARKPNLSEIEIRAKWPYSVVHSVRPILKIGDNRG